MKKSFDAITMIRKIIFEPFSEIANYHALSASFLHEFRDHAVAFKENQNINKTLNLVVKLLSIFFKPPAEYKYSQWLCNSIVQ